MAKTNVVWLSYHQPEILARGYWDQGLLEDIFKQGEYNHVTSVDDLFDDDPDTYQLKPGAVVIINGRTHINDADKINADIAKLRWVLFIDTGDEEASFPWRDIKHPVMRVWMMLPRMRVHDDVHFYLPNGYRPNTHELLGSAGYQEKHYDWFFAGQINHERREQCLQEANYLINSGENKNGTLVTTERFGEEKMPYEEYLARMANTKIVFCPSGVESPDNFRLYEALEAGCLPIVDAFSTKHKHPGFWQYMFGHDIPFPVVDYWDAIPKLLPELLLDWRARANKCFAWWQLKKREIKWQLIDDIKELSR